MYVHIFYALFKRTTFHLRSQFPPLSILSFVFTTPPYLEKPWDTANQSVYALLRASLIHSRGGTRGEPVFLHRTGRAIGSGKNIQTSLPGTNGTIRCAEIGQIPSKTFDAKQQTLAADNRRFPLLERWKSAILFTAIIDRAAIPRGRSTSFRRVIDLQTLALRAQRLGCKFEGRRDPIRHDRWTWTRTIVLRKAETRGCTPLCHIIWLRWIQSAFVPTVLCPGSDVRDRVSPRCLITIYALLWPISTFVFSVRYVGY